MTGSSITHANGAERLKSTQKRPNRSEKKNHDDEKQRRSKRHIEMVKFSKIFRYFVRTPNRPHRP